MSSTDPAPRPSDSDSQPQSGGAIASDIGQPERLLPPAAMPLLALNPTGQALTIAQVQQIAPAALAYIGDAVYELHIRARFLWPPLRSRDYHRQVVGHVNATYQAQVADCWMAHLTEAERDWWRRGRNAAVRRSNQVSHVTYQAASGLETLVGYLYLTNPHRLQELFAQLPPAATTT